MGTIPILRTWSVGETVTAAELNSNVRDSINFLLAVPRCIMTNSATTTVASSISPSAMTFNVETVDSDTMHSGSNAFITANTPGMYEVFVQVHYNFVTEADYEAVYCFVGFQVNSATWGSGSYIMQDVRCPSNTSAFGTSCYIGLDVPMNAGDTVNFFKAHNLGSSTTYQSGNFGSQATVQWVGTL